MSKLECRVCGAPLHRTFVDLGAAPPCEAILSAQDAQRGEVAYPLHVRICTACLLVQLPEVIPAEDIFTADYAYFSSYSTSWVEHARQYALAMIGRLDLGPDSRVIEVASNDGYLLRHFRDAGIPCLGVEPTANTAAAAVAAGIPTQVCFLGAATGAEIAARHGRADLVTANNVYAHVPDLADFTLGLSALLAPTGTLTMEFPHLMRRAFPVLHAAHRAALCRARGARHRRRGGAVHARRVVARLLPPRGRGGRAIGGGRGPPGAGASRGPA